ncbi:hypothetical protein BDB00DRAFT_869312 [Zychaea mexicana]|uniref:uncharacterized protein n=1 Tax=Zychaea mexicana TaxID=64656 RepID=UPI0022FE1570|nr:uncharacterized protein BDB00DRAFT_869312 [Zychaea mexicana]KAI9496740.1 hypothetical protein BDB00DRAFT_869312 [Zychaea mexicana]
MHSTVSFIRYIRRCPNLLHLYLDSGGSIHQGHCIMQALKHCPQLKTAVVNEKAEMPPTVKDGVDGKSLSDTTFSLEARIKRSPKELRRLVLAGLPYDWAFFRLAGTLPSAAFARDTSIDQPNNLIEANDGTRRTLPSYATDITVDDIVLKSIASNCRLRIKALKRLHASKDTCIYQGLTFHHPGDKQAADRILQERGGSFIFGFIEFKHLIGIDIATHNNFS